MKDKNAENDENADPSDDDSAGFLPTKNIVHGWFHFTKKRESTIHTLYWCNHSRSEKCKVKLKQIFDGSHIIKGEYTKGCKFKNGIEHERVVFHDYTNIMKERVEELRLDNVALRPKKSGW